MHHSLKNTDLPEKFQARMQKTWLVSFKKQPHAPSFALFTSSVNQNTTYWYFFFIITFPVHAVRNKYETAQKRAISIMLVWPVTSRFFVKPWMGIEICDMSFPVFLLGIDRKRDPENQPVSNTLQKHTHLSLTHIHTQGGWVEQKRLCDI